MRFIPLDILKEFLDNPINKNCALCSKSSVQIHHNLIYGGSQVSDIWTLIALCSDCHSIEKRKDIKEKLDWIMLCKGTDEQLKQYSKIDNLIEKRARLIEKFGSFPEK